jgi:hypothetical protein
VSGTNVPLDAIVVHGADDRRLFDIVEARKIRDLDDEALGERFAAKCPSTTGTISSG